MRGGSSTDPGAALAPGTAAGSAAEQQRVGLAEGSPTAEVLGAAGWRSGVNSR